MDLQKQADVSTSLLLLGVLCHMLPLMFKYGTSGGERTVEAGVPTLQLSRACSIVMLLAYVAYIFFQLKTHRQFFEAQEVRDTPAYCEIISKSTRPGLFD